MRTDFETLVAELRDRPGMYGVDDSFAQTCVYLEGIDYALDGGPLMGFREWLIVRHGGGDNLGWASLVLRVAFGVGHSGDLPSKLRRPLAGGVDQQARDALFEMLDEFFQVRSQPDGLPAIFDAYVAWKRAQSWSTDLPPIRIATVGQDGENPRAEGNAGNADSAFDLDLRVNDGGAAAGRVDP